MNSHQTKVLQAFRRMLGWLVERPELTTAKGDAPAPAIAQQAVGLESAVSNLTKAAAEQEAAIRTSAGATAEVLRIRYELYTHHLVPTALVARSTIPDVVKMTEALRAPANGRDHERLLAAASAMVEAGTLYKAQLVASGLPTDFVEQIESLVKSYRAAIDARGQATGALRFATKRLHEAMRQGRRAVTTLHALVRRELKSDPAAFAQWKQIKRVILTATRSSAAPAAAKEAAVASAQPLKNAA